MVAQVQPLSHHLCNHFRTTYDVTMKSLTLRLEDGTHDYVTALASASGLSINMTVEALARAAQLAGIVEVTTEPQLRTAAGGQ